MSDLMLDVDQAGELKAAFRRGDWTNADIKRLSECKKDNLALIRDVLLGRAIINAVKHIVDCDADPFVPGGWKVEKHKKCGQLNLSEVTPALYLSKDQQNGKVIEGNKIRKELATKVVLNANVLDYYLAHPELIPEEWKGKVVFFWNTIYRRSDGNLCVRYLCRRGGQWDWSHHWLGYGWDSHDPAAVLAS